MQVWNIIAGFSTTMLAICLMLLMLLKSCQTVIEDAVKKAEQDAKKQAEFLAERKFKEMLETTQYKVHFGMCVVDEMKREKEGDFHDE